MISLHLFLKLLVVFCSVSLIYFGLSQDLGFGFLLKLFALSLGASILISFVYPYVRGVQKGDKVSVVPNSVIPAIFGKGGTALNQGRVNSEIRIRFDDGREAVGVVESYEGFMSLPKIRLVYEEKLVE